MFCKGANTSVLLSLYVGIHSNSLGFDHVYKNVSSCFNVFTTYETGGDVVEELRQAVEQLTKEELVKLLILLANESVLSVSIVNDILGDMS